MRFLQLIKKIPFPPRDGESLLVSNFNNELKKKVDKIDLLSFNTIKHYFDVKQLPKEQNHYNEIYDIYLDNRVKWFDAFLNLFSNTPYHISRYIRQDFDEKLITILNKNTYDFILIESIFLAPYIPTIRKYSKAKIIIRAHNVEYEIWERITQNTANPIKKTYLTYLTKKLKKYELAHIGEADIIVTLTQRDLDKFKAESVNTTGFVVPAGISITSKKEYELKELGPLEISFLGSLDWRPNIEGLDWFIEKIWNSISNSHPKSELHIAGRNTPKSFHNLKSNNIKVHGEVPDSKEFLLSYPIMIVPLLSGGGMRLKILEALALGRIVISTSIGLEGIEASDGVNILVANTEEEFEDKLIFCFNNPESLKDISRNAIKLYQEKYNTTRIVDGFVEGIM